jgi:hypothetical protein
METTFKQKIYINTSDIAAYIGQNYFDFVTPFERIWKKCDIETYKNLINQLQEEIVNKEQELSFLELEKEKYEEELENKKITKRQYVLKIKKLEEQEKESKQKIESIQEKIDQIDLTHKQQLEKLVGDKTIQNMESKQIDTLDKRHQMTEALEALDVSEKKLNVLKKTAESYINKTHGTLKEDSAIEMFEAKYDVKLDTSQQFNKRYLKDISQSSKYDWYICGKVDGLFIQTIEPYNSYIVEVKNRTKSFFANVRDYEKTQIHLYMWMLEMDNAKLVEKFNNKIKVTNIPREEMYINDIMDSLKLFITIFENKFLSNMDTKREYTKKETDEKKQFIKKMFFSEITKLNNQKILERQAYNSSDDDDCMIEDL